MNGRESRQGKKKSSSATKKESQSIAESLSSATETRKKKKKSDRGNDESDHDDFDEDEFESKFRFDLSGCIDLLLEKRSSRRESGCQALINFLQVFFFVNQTNSSSTLSTCTSTLFGISLPIVL